MESQKRQGRWWLFGLPLLICLPCVLPALVAGMLAVGGIGALGSFLSGSGGLLVVGVAIVLIISASGVHARWRLRGGRISLGKLPEEE